MKIQKTNKIILKKNHTDQYWSFKKKTMRIVWQCDDGLLD
jgi:hypothetical protein